MAEKYSQEGFGPRILQLLAEIAAARRDRRLQRALQPYLPVRQAGAEEVSLG